MEAKRPTIEFFFDILSAYSYIGFETLLSLDWEVNIALKPFLLFKVSKESGNIPPAMIKSKRSFVLRDLQRQAGHCGIKFCVPKRFPINTIPIMRFLVLLNETNRIAAFKATKVLFNLYWGCGFDVSIFANVVEKLAYETGFSKDELAGMYKKSNEDENYLQILDKNCAEALDAGAFGAPTMLVKLTSASHKEFFFGSDRFHHIQEYLESEQPALIPSKSKL
ncbi:thioredoxin-like protein [Rozella allomycis CSF55]|uniref:Glutathione S-transferase kappa n=1 Tax=Rozella allomycis (strain CSF55) TaxID=988480 RepID=A0A075ATD5_ROZAC|nr:Thioredoxin-like fold domain-containing protein [Rozella allomycis CSF55]RKP21751.1 thioredoxin-like protein [Rozella allomycis CSF55]|eukprot:EPZ33531.1 Thioredoxin-like fold domain-containing protein [Rozella allomycis CSF55]